MFPKAPCKDRIADWIRRHPRTVWVAMVFVMAVSAGLAATVMRPDRKPMPDLRVLAASFSTEAGQAGKVMQAMAGMSGIQAELDSLIGRDSLTTSDSLRLRVALERFMQATNAYAH